MKRHSVPHFEIIRDRDNLHYFSTKCLNYSIGDGRANIRQQLENKKGLTL